MGIGGSRAGLMALVMAGLLQGQMAQAQSCAPDQLHLRKADGDVQGFAVEIADNNDERAKGLMFRPAMAAETGMLFIYDQPQAAAFWMKNTLIPLDMLFIDMTGRITRIHKGAVPGDTTPIKGGDRIKFVLEINAGEVEKLGLATGDVIQHPAVDPVFAAWPCNAD